MSRHKFTAKKFWNSRKGSAAKQALPLAVWLLGAVVANAATSVGGIVQSKHNLSISGLGNIRASAVAGDKAASELCIFCHTPHTSSGQRALWNHVESGSVYVPYQSSTTKASIGQPTGALLSVARLQPAE